jgi:uncharacterized protein (TIGR01244 family)
LRSLQSSVKHKIMFITLTPDFSVAGQLPPTAMAEAAAAGFTLVINNRPDGEEPGQSDSAHMAAAAQAAGLAYVHIPMGVAGLSPDMVLETRIAIADASGPVLAFCRSGNRSTILWGLALAASGEDPTSLIQTAATAGYDLRPVIGLMQNLAAQKI